VIYFYSNRQKTRDIYRAARANPTLPWDPPQLVGQLNTDSLECSPWVDPAETVIYFSGTGNGSAGKGDLWVATRPDASSAWGARVNLGSLNTTSDEEDPWIAPDLTTIYFSSTRTGNGDLYRSSR
jgi:hypothetical protein